MRTYRSRLAVFSAVTTAALALTLTACGGDDTGAGAGAKESGVAGASSPSASASVSASPSAVEQSGDKEQGKQVVGGTGSATAPACTAKGLGISAETQDGSPYTHLVLTAKNTSGRTCRMTGFPEIRFLDNARGTVPSVAKSKPVTAVVLEPGVAAYAAVRISDGGRKESTEAVKDFSVTLPGGAGMAIVRAPGAEGIAVDPARWATGYWTRELRNGADEF
ncbi:DUF4232 domain-containing protein [Streptomyces sp. LaPpAH-108]|uniref:DUF4232 domain-containing protein n=1 Tax=Streptomyces sp. LaPpAH-108 TaxID=1155714 RepID=UPI00036DAC50|nr:DUF4232 domain-containing protein [Streptomyces sp. LaPpAH-108]